MNRNQTQRHPEGFQTTCYILVSLITGLVFGTMDGIINGNSYAAGLMACYKPILREQINMAIGIAIDLAYGFLMTAIFLLIRSALPGKSRTTKGFAYGLGMWFFRVVMSVLSSWMMFAIPVETLVYVAMTGLLEMLFLGALISWMLKPEIIQTKE